MLGAKLLQAKRKQSNAKCKRSKLKVSVEESRSQSQVVRKTSASNDLENRPAKWSCLSLNLMRIISFSWALCCGHSVSVAVGAPLSNERKSFFRAPNCASKQQMVGTQLVTHPPETIQTFADYFAHSIWQISFFNAALERRNLAEQTNAQARNDWSVV